MGIHQPLIIIYVEATCSSLTQCLSKENPTSTCDGDVKCSISDAIRCPTWKDSWLKLVTSINYSSGNWNIKSLSNFTSLKQRIEKNVSPRVSIWFGASHSSDHPYCFIIVLWWSVSEDMFWRSVLLPYLVWPIFNACIIIAMDIAFVWLLWKLERPKTRQWDIFLVVPIYQWFRLVVGPHNVLILIYT